ncbi:MAG: DUF4943 family protein [Saprospiraceae bacterium]|nr:DUF4943 family protein [Saprospiraceae bacterium]
MNRLFICFTAFLLLVSCNKEKTEVEIFINSLIEDKTETFETTDFSSDHITELLKYRDNELIINNFPRNPVSSLYIYEVTVGMYVLWTIESIRLKEINDLGLYMYPSLNPRITRTSSGELVDQELILPTVAKAYFDWWYSSLPLEEKLSTNPLEGLDLSWN